jgi:hypothetical protein
VGKEMSWKGQEDEEEGVRVFHTHPKKAPNTPQIKHTLKRKNPKNPQTRPNTPPTKKQKENPQQMKLS